jgi:hypothetical protein
MGENSNTNQDLQGELEGKRLLERPRHRWKGNIRRAWTKFIWLRVETSGRL